MCASKSGFNGTCYTASECTAKGGSARWPFHIFALDFVFVCVQYVLVYLLFVYLQICVFAVGHVRLLLASAVSSHSLVEAPLIRVLYNIRLKKNENIKKKYNVKQIILWPILWTGSCILLDNQPWILLDRKPAKVAGKKWSLIYIFLQNNTYAIISSYLASTDADPCTYTFCRLSSKSFYGVRQICFDKSLCHKQTVHCTYFSRTSFDQLLWFKDVV